MPQDNLRIIKSFKVDLVSDFLIEHDCVQHVSDCCKPPDHSLLTTEVYCREIIPNIEYKDDSEKGKGRKQYNFDSAFDYLASPIWQQSVLDIVGRLEENNGRQAELDGTYAKLCENIFLELDQNLRYTICGRKTRKRYRNAKPYWDDDLSNLWKDMARKEKEFVKYKGLNRGRKTQLLNRFKESQRLFDKELGNKSREYRRKVVDSIDSLSVDNPKEFWAQIQKLGPRVKTSIPLKIRDGSNFITEETEVLKRWEHDFNDLLNPQRGDSTYDDEFLQNSQRVRNNIEHDMRENNYQCNAALNKEVSIDEIEKVISKLKNNKSVGNDQVPNEVIKCNTYKYLLFKLVQFCFNNGLVPTIWEQAIIKPIPKGATKDPFVPLNYRGISLISWLQTRKILWRPYFCTVKHNTG